ncbi:MAG: hypothetical protein JXA82_03460 [Sedimentisphaerales bacterium]|nr:hypothetical protein [Sedimentisphaerales bacterium]
MDSEHRHELKTNELADWIAHAPEFFQTHGKWIAGVILLTVAVIAIKYGIDVKKETSFGEKAAVAGLIESLGREKLLATRVEEGKNNAEGIATAAENLGKTADSLTDNALAAMALIKKGDMLRSGLHYQGIEVGPDAIAKVANEAHQAYQQAMELAKGTPNELELTGMARFGQGLCAEELGKYEEVETIYKEIADNQALVATVLPTQARLRLQYMDDYKGTYTFADTPTPEPAAGTTSIPGLTIPTSPQETMKPAGETKETESKSETTPKEEPAASTENTSKEESDQEEMNGLPGSN